MPVTNPVMGNVHGSVDGESCKEAEEHCSDGRACTGKEEAGYQSRRQPTTVVREDESSERNSISLADSSGSGQNRYRGGIRATSSGENHARHNRKACIPKIGSHEITAGCELTPQLTCGRIKQNASEASFQNSPDRFSARYGTSARKPT